LILALAAGAVMVGAIVLFNVTQRALAERDAPVQHRAPPVVAAAPPPSGPVALGAPLPPPVESTTPTPYETPGLAAATAAGGSSDAVTAAKRAAAADPTPEPAPPPENLPATFSPNGTVYGAEPQVSVVTLQARKAGSLIVRGADGSVYFARQLSVGEAYRAPPLKGLSVEVSEPTAFQVFVGGQTKGLMPANQSTVAKLVG
jgi:hypothetical protein